MDCLAADDLFKMRHICCLLGCSLLQLPAGRFVCWLRLGRGLVELCQGWDLPSLAKSCHVFSSDLTRLYFYPPSKMTPVRIKFAAIWAGTSSSSLLRELEDVQLRMFPFLSNSSDVFEAGLWMLKSLRCQWCSLMAFYLHCAVTPGTHISAHVVLRYSRSSFPASVWTASSL